MERRRPLVEPVRAHRGLARRIPRAPRDRCHPLQLRRSGVGRGPHRCARNRPAPAVARPSHRCRTGPGRLARPQPRWPHPGPGRANRVRRNPPAEGRGRTGPLGRPRRGAGGCRPTRRRPAAAATEAVDVKSPQQISRSRSHPWPSDLPACPRELPTGSSSTRGPPTGGPGREGPLCWPPPTPRSRRSSEPST